MAISGGDKKPNGYLKSEKPLNALQTFSKPIRKEEFLKALKI